jgi:hypothetical protein
MLITFDFLKILYALYYIISRREYDLHLHCVTFLINKSHNTYIYAVGIWHQNVLTILKAHT